MVVEEWVTAWGAVPPAPWQVEHTAFTTVALSGVLVVVAGEYCHHSE